MSSPAVINYGPETGNVELRELPRPEIGPEEVLLEVAAVGVCGSDLHQWAASHGWKVDYPVVLGHEFAGIIAECGEQVANWQPGDRVVSETAARIDPSSPMSRRGLYNLDPTRKGYGVGANGGMTKFVRVPARCLHRVPEELPLEHAALTEPCCVAYSAVVKNAPIQPGDRVVVLGPGPIGLLCGALARMNGADVAVVGLKQDRERLKVAEQYGCLGMVDGLEEWAREVDGLGVDVVIDAAGVSATLKTAIEIVRPNGWISKVGWGPEPFNHSLDQLVLKNVTLQGSFSHNWPIWEKVIGLLASGRLNVEPIIGGIWPLAEWETAFQTMHSGQIPKAILKP